MQRSLRLPLLSLQLLFGVGLLLACQPQPAAKAARLPRIYRRGQKYTFEVRAMSAQYPAGYSDTVAITCFGQYKAGQYDTTQRILAYSYGATAEPQSSSGVLENDSVVWCHPPRDGDYGVLELSPFPFVKLPLKKGRQWHWELGVGSHWGNPKWAEWKGDILVTSTYRVLGQYTLKTSLGALRCWLIRGQASCAVGRSSLNAYYHPQYGFVRLNYQTLHHDRLELELVKVTTVHLPDSPFEGFSPGL